MPIRRSTAAGCRRARGAGTSYISRAERTELLVLEREVLRVLLTTLLHFCDNLCDRERIAHVGVGGIQKSRRPVPLRLGLV